MVFCTIVHYQLLGMSKTGLAWWFYDYVFLLLRISFILNRMKCLRVIRAWARRRVTYYCGLTTVIFMKRTKWAGASRIATIVVSYCCSNACINYYFINSSKPTNNSSYCYQCLVIMIILIVNYNICNSWFLKIKEIKKPSLKDEPKYSF